MNVTEKGLASKQTLLVNGEEYIYYDIRAAGNPKKTASLPFSIKILLEAAIRNVDGKHIKKEHIDQLVHWETTQWEKKEIPFKPVRIVFQDFTGIPAIVDLASMRSAVERKGGDVSRINPQIPVDLVIDHSVIIDHFGHRGSLDANVKREYERNLERYRFVRWAQKSFENFNAVPPSNGIVHQVNLEYLSSAVQTKRTEQGTEIYPDSLVGTDSHTPMINGLGTVGWGVGGIEAEAAMLGQPLYFVIPQVVGVKLTGTLQKGVTATDLALTITQLLRNKGVVGKFVEFYGSGLSRISLTDRATIANMAPEYGATMGYFPVDKITMNYLRLTGRGEVVPLAEAYFRSQGLYREDNTPDPSFTEKLELDLSTIAPSVAGPKRPQDCRDLRSMKQSFELSLTAPLEKNGYGLNPAELNKKVKTTVGEEIGTGSVVLASITSCTNTSNPNVMIAAGLLAKKALKLGLQKPAFVKASLTPGSKAVKQYLKSSNLLNALESLGFYVDGYGCATCCGNSGALTESVEEAIRNHHLVTASVISGNRNFEGRVHPLIKANYLCSPPLVVAFALAGTVKIDMTSEPIGFGYQNHPVYLKDIWPTPEEIQKVMNDTINQALFKEQYSNIFENEMWVSIDAPDGMIYEWDPSSTYIQEVPYVQAENKKDGYGEHLKDLKVLLFLGDSITTDHISPAGAIPVSSPAGTYLIEKGVPVKDFNAYGARRGNHQVMMRGTFANIRIRNKLAGSLEGGYTKYMPTGEIMSVYDAAMSYQENKQGLMVIAGKEYGTGSSRDWAAKGTALLGVKVVLAESFERIHRSNLVGMGVLPLQFMEGENAQILQLDGTENVAVKNFDQSAEPGGIVDMEAVKEDGAITEFKAIIRLDSQIEMEYYHNGGILPTVLNSLMDK
ncbi:aconitate hydratase AcnA [Siminovitchia sp. 179-K 8D1 HS]|uniref:aconitate hydratase AcnA n=1 Tax=Siminovitchia sp. 179-K 8D1 HS TaxID=3142385 RepID=UPI0039A14C21